MSWMDSWSRPSKHAPMPPPLYLTVGDTVPYCHTCGRVISERRKAHNATPIKYCSARCRNNKPSPTDRKIEATFAALLNGTSLESLHDSAGVPLVGHDPDEPQDQAARPFRHQRHRSGAKSKKTALSSTKGEPRITITCSAVEALVFAREPDPHKVYGRRKNRAARFIAEKPEDWKSVDMVDPPASDSWSDGESDGGIELGSAHVRPPQSRSHVNGSVGGEKGWAERTEETEEMRERRREGQKRAQEREAVRQAARRACAFGILVADGEAGRRKCEAVARGVVVEASFAKGEWGIRWREGE